MTEDKIERELIDVKKAVSALNGGLLQMLNIQAQQSATLKEILAAVTAEPEGESPLVALLKQIAEATEANAATLARIEKRLSAV